MSSSLFKENDKLGDSSNFSTWKIRLEIIIDNNDVLEYIQWKLYNPLENSSIFSKNKYKKGESKAKKIIVYGLQENFLA